MKEGQDKAYTELPKDARVKIKHEPNRRAPERIKYSSDDILDSTLAGTSDDPFVKVQESEQERSAKKAEKRQKVLDFIKNRIWRPVVTFVKSFFTPEKRPVTLSVLGAIVVAILLLTVPNLFKPSVDTSSDHDPVTGLSNQEVTWLEYMNVVRAQVYEYQGSDFSAPKQEVLTYFSELLEDHPYVAEQLDIRTLQAEFYENFGMDQEALQMLKAANTDYPQPSDDNSDISAYFSRSLHYYRKLRDINARLGYSTEAAAAQKKIDQLNSELLRITGLDLTLQPANSGDSEWPQN